MKTLSLLLALYAFSTAALADDILSCKMPTRLFCSTPASPGALTHCRCEIPAPKVCAFTVTIDERDPRAAAIATSTCAPETEEVALVVLLSKSFGVSGSAFPKAGAP